MTPDEHIKLMEQRLDRVKRMAINGDSDPMLKRIAEKMKTAVDQNFQRGQDPDGNKWARLSVNSTLLNRRGDKPLRDTGALQRSITYNTGNGFAQVGTADIRAPTHQFGAKKGGFARIPTKNGKMRSVPWGDIPARPFFGINDKNRALYKKMILHYIETGIVT